MENEISLLQQLTAAGNLEHCLLLIILLLVRAWVCALRALDRARREEIARLSRWLDRSITTSRKKSPDQ